MAAASPAGSNSTPEPTEEEAAAIMAAASLLWAAEPEQRETPTNDGRWRFSGRWWNRSTPAPRHRRGW